MVKITKLSPIQIYRLLPKTNCGKCGEESCMAFAVKLLNLQTTLDKCRPLVEDPKYRKNYEELLKLLKKPVREVYFGPEDRKLVIGGEYVMHRHELTLLTPTVIAVEVDDSLSQDELERKLEFVKKFKYEYLGFELRIDTVAVKYVSGDVDRYVKVVEFIRERLGKPLILCSADPRPFEQMRQLLRDERPLIYGATPSNWERVLALCRETKAPCVISSPGDLDTLFSLVKTFNKYGVEDLCLDPGTFPKSIGYTIKMFSALRWLACNEEYELAGYPLVAVPATVWYTDVPDDVKPMYESALAAMLLIRFADLLIMRSDKAFTYLPIVVLRKNYYTDPRRPATVTPGLKIIGNPNEYSPVLVTCNFALTYSIVTSDLEKGKANAYLLVIDTEGYAVDVSVAAGKFNPEVIAKFLKESGIEQKVKHRILIIPGKAARLASEIEEKTGWKVVVGPVDSADLPKFLETKWPEILKQHLQ